jgi:alpha-beta hydrolase superfamily lysophospholipase
VRFGEYVRPGAQPIVREMAGRCLAEPSTVLSIGTIMAMDKTMWSGDPNRGALAARLRENIPTGAIPAPLLLGQGAADQLVVPDAQDAYVAERCAAGQQVDYRTYAGRDHVPLVEPDSPAITDLIEWTTQRLAGAPPSNTCP